MAFKKGQSGNPGGRPKGSKLLDLHDLLKNKSKADGHEEEHYTNEFVKFLLDNYKEDARLMIWMGDHLFGKAPQPLTDADGEPLAIAGFTFVRNGDSHPDNPANA